MEDYGVIEIPVDVANPPDPKPQGTATIQSGGSIEPNWDIYSKNTRFKEGGGRQFLFNKKNIQSV